MYESTTIISSRWTEFSCDAGGGYDKTLLCAETGNQFCLSISENKICYIIPKVWDCVIYTTNNHDDLRAYWQKIRQRYLFANSADYSL